MLDRLHESIGDANRDIETSPAPRCLFGRNEGQDVRMVTTQNSHLSASSGTCGLQSRAGLVKGIDESARPGSIQARAVDACALGPDTGKVIAHATAAAQGLGRLRQCVVDTGVTRFIAPTQTVTHRLHKTIGQRHGHAGACTGHDATSPDGPSSQVLTEHRLKVGLFIGGFDRSHGFGNAVKNIPGSQLTWLKVFAFQDRLAQGLWCQE
jgi:hypothetical protein